MADKFRKLKENMRLLKYILILSFVTALFFGNPAYCEEYTFDYQKIIPTDRQIDLSLELIRGKVSVTGTENDRLIIEATKIIRASNRQEAEEVADHVEIKVKNNKSEVAVQTNYLTMINRNQSFWKKILGGSTGNIVTVNYNIQLPFGCNISISSMASIIEFSNVEGKIKVENNTGSIRGEFIYGPITLQQDLGEIDLRWVEGDIRLKATSSRVFINQAHGAIDVSTQTGDVTIQTELDSPKDYFVQTYSGMINFIVPSSASGELNIETESGKIKTEMPVAIKSMTNRKLVGKFGRGGPAITLSSSSGDVIVELF